MCAEAARLNRLRTHPSPGGQFRDRYVDPAAVRGEFRRLLPHPQLDCGLLVDALLLGVLADILADFHRAEVWSAHRTEMRGLRRRSRQCLVVEIARRLRIQ